MPNSVDIEYTLLDTGPGGANYEVFFPGGGSTMYAISDRDCMMMRRNREDVLEYYILEDLKRLAPDIDSIRLVRR